MFNFYRFIKKLVLMYTITVQIIDIVNFFLLEI